MFSFSANGKTYKVKFGYGVLTQSDILTQVSSMGAINNPKDMIKMLPELILVGLQKKHKDEFGYETEEEKKIAYDKVCDLLDEYEDDSTEENPQNGFILFEKASQELEKNGFLSGMVKAMEEKSEEEKKLPKTPQDHKKKS
nr:MAG TPA: tail assembly chaperone protein [Caudoviricetes sp.]